MRKQIEDVSHAAKKINKEGENV
jgi:hypothetical protein